MRLPKTRNPAAANGRVNRKAQASSTEISVYSGSESLATTLSVYAGRNLLGTLHLAPGRTYAADSNGGHLGVFKSRQEALDALTKMAAHD